MTAAPQTGRSWLTESLFKDLGIRPRGLDEVAEAEYPGSEPTFGELMTGAEQQGAAMSAQATLIAEAIGTSGAGYFLEPGVAEQIVDTRMALRGVRTSREMKELADMGFWDALGHGISHPLRAGLPTAVSSLRASAAPMIAGAAAGPIGMMAGAGLGSGVTEGAASFFEAIEHEMAARDMNISSADDWRTAMSDGALIASARNRATVSAIAVGAFDALSAGIAGKATAAASGAIRRGVTAAGESVVLGGGAGIAGETAKQLLTEGGITSPSEIAAEFFAGLPLGGIEVAAGVARRPGRSPQVLQQQRLDAATKIIVDRIRAETAMQGEIVPQIDVATGAAIEMLDEMPIENVAAVAIAMDIPVNGNVTEADKPALIAQIVEEREKVLELESEDLEPELTIVNSQEAVEETPVLSQEARTAASETPAGAETSPPSPTGDLPTPIEVAFPKKRLADMIEDKWPGITGRIGQVDREGMGDAAERAVDTAAAQGDDLDRFIARIFKMDKEGQLGREDIGSLVGLNTDDLAEGDTFQIDGEQVSVTAADDQNITLSIQEAETRLPIGDGEDMVEAGAVRTFSIPRGQTIPANEKSHARGTVVAMAEQPQWVRGVNRSQNRDKSGDRFFSTSEEIAANFAIEKIDDKPQFERLSQADEPKNPLRVDGGKDELAEMIGYKGDPFEFKFDAIAKQYAQERGHDSIIYESGTFEEPELHLFGRGEGDLPLTPDDKPSGVADALFQLGQSIEDKGRELLKGNVRRGGNRRGSRAGATILHTQMAGLIAVATGRAVKYGAKSFKEVQQVVERVIGEIAPFAKNRINVITRDVMKILRQSRDKETKQVVPEYVERSIAKLVAKAEARDRREQGSPIKEQIRSATGARRVEPLTVSEKEALKARMKGQVLAAKIGHKSGTETQRMLREVKSVVPKSIRRSFLKLAGDDTLFTDASPAAILRDIATFLERTGMAVDMDAISLAKSIDDKKLRDLTPDQAIALRKMVRLFKAEHNHFGKVMADDRYQQISTAAAAIASELAARPKLDQSQGTPRNRGWIKNILADMQNTPLTRAILMGKTARRFFHDNFVKPQERMYVRLMGLHDIMRGIQEQAGWSKADVDRRRMILEPVELPDGRTIRMTRSEMMSVYALGQRREAEAKMTANGFKAARYRGTKDAEFAVSGTEREVTDAIRAIGGALSDQERELVDASVEYVASNITPDANVVSERLTGSPIFNENDYTLPMRVDRENQNLTVQEILNSGNVIGGWIENAGFTKELQKHGNPILIGDFFAEVDRHARDMAVYADMLVPIRDARLMLKNETFTQALRKTFGREMETRLLRMLIKLTGLQQDPRGTLENLAARFNRNIASSLLGARPTVYLSNRLGGITLAHAFLSPEEMARLDVYTAASFATLDLGGFTSEEQATLAKLESNGYMGHRWKELDSYRLAVPGLEEREVEISRFPSLSQAYRKAQRVGDFFARHMRYAERRNAVAVFRAMVDAGETEARAIERVAEITRRTQNPITPLEESDFIDQVKRSPYAAAIWMFHGQLNIMRNMLGTAIAERNPQQIAAVSGLLILNSALLIVARELWRGSLRGFSEEEDKRKRRDLPDHLTQMLSDAANMLAPGAGDVLIGPMIRVLRHKPYFDGSTWQENMGRAIVWLPADIKNAVLAEDPKTAKRRWFKVSRDVSRILGTGLGLPFPLVSDTAEQVFSD